jgi:hypothetical protein
VLGALPWIGGCSSGGLAKHQGAVSDHFDGERFFNPGGAGPRGFLDLARWRLGGNSEDWPDTYPSPFPPDLPPSRVEGKALHVSFVGHATFLIQGAGLNILTDPVWSERASPFSFIGPKRANPLGITFDDLPPIDVALVSHGHYDHLDVETLSRLWQRDRPRIITPLGNDVTICGHDAAIEVTTADWAAWCRSAIASKRCWSRSTTGRRAGCGTATAHCGAASCCVAWATACSLRAIRDMTTAVRFGELPSGTGHSVSRCCRSAPTSLGGSWRAST